MRDHEVSFRRVDPAECMRAYCEVLRSRGYDDILASVLAAASASGAPAETPPPLGDRPSVSCLMVSHNDLPLVKRSIAAYLAQTHANKELVIVRDPSSRDGRIAGYVRALERDDITLVEPREKLPLSGLRQLS